MKNRYSDKTDIYLLHFWFWHPEYEDRKGVKHELNNRGWKEILDKMK